jgi:hypothetical protein
MRHAKPTRTDRIVERKMKTVIGEHKRRRLRSSSGARVPKRPRS